MAEHNLWPIIYARKSTDSEDRQILSIDSQINELERFAQHAGLTINKVFRESKSAKAPGRPVFDEMMFEIQNNRPAIILCWSLDRLARNPVDGGRLIGT